MKEMIQDGKLETFGSVELISESGLTSKRCPV